MLVFPCPACNAKLQLADDMAGKKVRCGACQGVTTAPSGAELAGITSDPAPPRPTKRPARREEEEEEVEERRGRAEPPATSADGAVVATAAGLGVGAIVIAVSIVGCLGCGVVAILVALLVPAVSKVREAAARTQTTNNMKQIGLAAHSFHDSFGYLPTPKHLKPQGPPAELSWRVSVLPYVEQQALFGRFDVTAAWDSPRNQPLLKPMPFLYQDSVQDAPDDPSGKTRFQYFTGPGTVWPDNSKRTLRDFTAGTSNTFLFAESTNPVPWSQPADMAVQAGQPLPLPNGRFLVTFADGSVRSVDHGRHADASLWPYLDHKNANPHVPLD